MKRKAFTLTELIVTMGILSMVVVVIAGMARYTAGRLKSAQIKSSNDALRSSLDVIGQKMNNANEKAKIDTENRYGFYYKNNILVVISGDASPEIYCTYFGKKDDALAMAQEKANSGKCSDTDAINLANNVTPENIKVTSFSIDSSKSLQMTELGHADQKEIPKVEIKVEAKDIADPTNIVTVKTTFTMDGENVNYLKN
jgi:prepilin-type N-terminal cleavage/methylation domain-containing protein